MPTDTELIDALQIAVRKYGYVALGASVRGGNAVVLEFDLVGSKACDNVRGALASLPSSDPPVSCGTTGQASACPTFHDGFGIAGASLVLLDGSKIALTPDNWKWLSRLPVIAHA